MLRAAPLCCVLIGGLACSPAGPPAGPKYTPSQSPESKTACPQERARAQSAREALLGEDLSTGTGSSLSSAAGQAVFAHAECEALALSAREVPVGSHDQVLAQLRSLRLEVQDVIGLFAEVARYDGGLAALRADVAAAKVKLSFATLVSKLSPPADMEPQGRAAFESELAEAAQILRGEVAAALAQTLAEVGGSEKRSTLEAEICQILLALEWEGAGC